MTERYYSAKPIAGPQITLTGSEAHHMLHVMRVSPGRQVVLFDGHGSEFDAKVISCGRLSVELAIGTKCPGDRELPFELVLGVPLPKGDRQRWLVEKAVELGVLQLVPLQSARSGESKPGAKLARYVIEATKQCGRNRLMEITQASAWEQWLSLTAPRKLIAHFGGQQLSDLDLAPAQRTLIMVGPEGGFTDKEATQAAANGWQPVDLGSRVLRVETAAVAIAAAVMLGCSRQ